MDRMSGIELLNLLLKAAAGGASVRVGVACFLAFPLRVLVGVGAGLEAIRLRVLRCGVVGLLIVDKLDNEGDFLKGVVGYNQNSNISHHSNNSLFYCVPVQWMYVWVWLMSLLWERQEV